MAVVVQGFFTATGTLIVAWYSGNLLAMDTYDFFLGTLCFFVSAMVMMILFSWKLGVDRGLMDLEDGSVIRIPRIYRFIMKFVTPTLLLAIFLTWLAQNIWVKQAAPIEALGTRGAWRSYSDGLSGGLHPVPALYHHGVRKAQGVPQPAVSGGKPARMSVYPWLAAAGGPIRRLDRRRI